jgi:hypothetical protein
VKYESPEAYQADEGPVREKLAAMAKARFEDATAKRLEEAASPVMDLFGKVETGIRLKKKRPSKQRLIGSILEDRP